MSHSVSIVNYYNTTPFMYGIRHSNFKSKIKLELDIPSICAQKLKNKKVDIGLVPVAILPELDSFNIITDYCIGAIGKVDSVNLYAEKPLDQLTHVLLDYQSKTSVTLIQVLNKFFWKKNIQFIPAFEGFEKKITHSTGAVIIGDRTFGLTQHSYKYDLAEEWQKYTSLPFVFACWVSNIKLADDFISDFNQTLEFGVSHIKEAVIENPKHVKGFDALDYLQNKISYHLDIEKKKGLTKFLELMKEL